MTWYERDPQRFLAERQLLKHFYPNARMFRKGKTISALLSVVGQKRCYLVRIDYPSDFPLSPPVAFPVDPVIRGTPHQYSKGRFCLHSTSEVGPQTTGKVMLDWALGWYEAYEEWLSNGKVKWTRTNRHHRQSRRRQT